MCPQESLCQVSAKNLQNWDSVSNLKFRKTSLKIRPRYERISKISSRGWHAWKNWYFTIMNFLAPANFLNHQIWKNDQKLTRATKIVKVKNQLFHACWPYKGIFEIGSCWGLIFRAVFLNFKLLTLSKFCKFLAKTWHSDSWGHITS